MARITVEDCLEKVDNQYDLVLLAKERTVQLNAGSPMLVEEDNDKRTIIALREIGDSKISVEELEKNAINRLRREPDEVEQLEDTEEVENDEFDVSEVTGADYLIVGELIKRGAVYDFFLRIVDVSAGKVVGSMAYEKVKSDKLKLVAKKAKKEIKSKLLQ